jgi:hypothetical protein
VDSENVVGLRGAETAAADSATTTTTTYIE